MDSTLSPSADDLAGRLNSAALVAKQTDGMSIRIVEGGVMLVYIWGSEKAGFKHLDSFTPWDAVLGSSENVLIRAITSLKKKASNFGRPV